jgi:GntR family transcriptional regulator
MLRRLPSLTEQVKSHIKQRILNGEFDGERIPSETDLAGLLGVSRTTIRDALSRLEIEGVIYRKQGAGTFVNKAGLQIKSRLEEIWSYEEVLADHGYAPSTRILTVEVGPPGAEIASALNMQMKESLILIQKLFLAEDEPVILTINHIPAALIALPYAEEDFLPPVFRFLQEFGSQRLAYYVSEIVPVVASPFLAQTLHLKAGSALISFAEIGYNEENVPVIAANSYFRDELLRLRLIRRETS